VFREVSAVSAFVVSNVHIDLLVTGILDGTSDGIIRPADRRAVIGRDSLGAMLAAENVRSVAYRYPRDRPDELPGSPDHLEAYTWTDRGYRPTAAELYNLARCYAYQACEHPAWSECAAKKLCDAVIEEIHARHKPAAKYAAWCRSGAARQWRREPWPELEAAPWSWRETDLAARAAAGAVLMAAAV
jgi:hypothetical protein